MQKRDPKPSTLSTIPWLLITGLGIGWLIGLSVSPVVSIVITSVTGSAAAIVAALSGLEDRSDQPNPANKGQTILAHWSINPAPLAILVLGIGFGSSVGVWARNHNWLGSAANSEVSQWVEAGLTDAGQNPNPSLGTYLFATSSPLCLRLLAAAKMPDATQLRNELASATVVQLQQLPIVISDTAILKQVVEQVLCADGR